ncbi:Origin recognition complex subunit [Thalictrum thalictroides]|uniref:Origin recognition complex subunit n=1 Tax=Thalictrum thalictroides TaxID=46969 RepID=A0A7J6WNS6_THATH|nr:Origin recognition complex subunit [Thalictrum thalictroides]
MTPSATPDSPPPSSPTANNENAESNLQPFFVLHKPIHKNSSRKSTQSAKTRRKIDLSTETPKSNKSKGAEQVEQIVDDHHYQQLRVEAFDIIWSKIEITIKEVLRGINRNVFNEIHQWVRESFAAIRSTAGTLNSAEFTCPYPLSIDIDYKKIFTGLVFTKNVEFVDDLLTFNDLRLHLKSQGCHVVNLSSHDFSAKSGIGGCIRSLLRQFVMVDPDVADITILASWYNEPENFDIPLVVIIDDMERCNGSVLSEFILMLSEWVIKLPVILVMGVATTIDAPRILLPAKALNYLEPCKFALGSPAERLDAVVEAVILGTNFGFDIGHKVTVFLRNYFLRQDGTVISFIKAVKIACAKHFVTEPLSFLCSGLLHEDCHGFLLQKCALLPESMREYAFSLPSCEGLDKTTPLSAESLASGISEIMKLKKNWSSIFMCLYEAAKFQKKQLVDILCEALDPDAYRTRSSLQRRVGEVLAKSPSVDHYSATKGSLILQVIRKVRDLPMKQLCQLLQIWGKHSEEIAAELHEKVKELQSLLKSEEENNGGQADVEGLSKMLATRRYMNIQRDKGKVFDKAVLLLESMIRDYLKPIECAPFHEIICFKNVDILQSALVGDPRRMIQVDLLKSHKFLLCSCCTKGGTVLLPSMHDTSIMYTLAQEHGDLINLHDWFKNFKSTIVPPCTSAKGKMRSPSSKKRKHSNEPEDLPDALVQARFCRAVIELQITGLLKMPNKRRPDYVQRVAFGL